MNGSKGVSRFLHPCTALGICVLFVGIAGCVSYRPYSFESSWSPSPDGHLIASTLTTGIERSGWDYSEVIKADTELRVRTVSGDVIRSTKWASGASRGATEPLRVVWNPSGTKLGVLWGWTGEVDVVDWPDFQRNHLASHVSSITWDDDSKLLCVQRDGKGDTMLLVARLDGFVATNALLSHRIPPGASKNSLSPKGDLIISKRGSELAIVDLSEGNRASPWQTRVASVEDVFWSRSGLRCLVSASAEPAGAKTGEKRKTIVLLFDRQTGQQLDLTEQLHARVPGTRFLFSQSADGAWGADGEWFVVTTYPDVEYPDFRLAKHWVCRISPWGMICIEEELGRDFSFPRPFPGGNRLGLVKPATSADGVHGIFVTQLTEGRDGTLHLTKPKAVFGTSGGVGDKWRWSEDGTKIHTFSGERPSIYPVPTAD